MTLDPEDLNPYVRTHYNFSYDVTSLNDDDDRINRQFKVAREYPEGPLCGIRR